MLSKAFEDIATAVDTTPETSLHLWTVEDYHRMIDAEIITEEHKVELLEGQIILRSAHKPPHASITQISSDYIRDLLRQKATIRVQAPVTLRPNSEPEPDVAVVRIEPQGYATAHPAPEDIYLLIEVADRTLNKDRKTKARTYAKAKIPEYFVLDVKSQQVYVFREPEKDNYTQQTILDKNAKLSLVAFRDIEIEIKYLFEPLITPTPPTPPTTPIP
ncbi:hypothetical protein DSM106972_042900 [Dulcicalothrix desertica PCC 7102]|uniref:Putative restriction endonuclease domain-containing protein n=1 Tax=Dulcicalothrix desertica PCC 7102 TaxID=232991 RepID=A0A433VF39_9CYAN|nr:Uma2 family endonuclease [Dulcicalothrix desertica]RUT04721.1 hypothetical protein DSM106972_042900 [Dulcicalothrix desertica PCC 7102]TWH42730.1 Uma2 family endonuclease [Dulcicalothrix desertica PCC 7102]